MNIITKLIIFLVIVNLATGSFYLKMRQNLNDNVSDQNRLDQKLEDLQEKESAFEGKIKKKDAEREKALTEERESQNKSVETEGAARRADFIGKIVNIHLSTQNSGEVYHYEPCPCCNGKVRTHYEWAYIDNRCIQHESGKYCSKGCCLKCE